MPTQTLLLKDLGSGFNSKITSTISDAVASPEIVSVFVLSYCTSMFKKDQIKQFNVFDVERHSTFDLSLPFVYECVVDENLGNDYQKLIDTYRTQEPVNKVLTIIDLDAILSNPSLLSFFYGNGNMPKGHAIYHYPVCGFKNIADMSFEKITLNVNIDSLYRYYLPYAKTPEFYRHLTTKAELDAELENAFGDSL